ncbi:MAG TPA: GDP-mannose 4,6-dehydratase [Actinomycetospora sp.]|uniref:GDP-mannose 4,6-dehydratase n=1 Tax=Actinomycetospora sp. TaxID=1872135 RepID=UPI002F4159CF
MLQAPEPADHVLATGTAHTVEEFAEACFSHVGLDWTRHVRFDERLLRPAEVDALVGDASRAARELGWRPRTFVPELARILVDAELSALAGPVPGMTSLAG